MTKATVTFDNSDLIEKGAYVDPTSTVDESVINPSIFVGSLAKMRHHSDRLRHMSRER